MTSAQAQAREDLKTLLQEWEPLEGMLVFSSAPEKITPPFIGIGPGDPYLDFDGVPFGGRRIHLAVTVVAGKGTNDVQAAALDDLIDEVIAACDADGSFTPVTVDRPGQAPLNNSVYLGCIVQVIREV